MNSLEIDRKQLEPQQQRPSRAHAHCCQQSRLALTWHVQKLEPERASCQRIRLDRQSILTINVTFVSLSYRTQLQFNRDDAGRLRCMSKLQLLC